MPSAPVIKTVPSFLDRAKEVIATQTDGMTGEKKDRAVYIWQRSLLHYAVKLHDKKVDAIATADVTEVLHPIWLDKKPTAKLVRKHIAKVFSSCIADELITRNPAAMEDNLEHKLRKQNHKVRNHPAMPYKRVAAYVAELEAHGTLGALALAFTILTCVRSNEAYKARWDDIDTDNIWTVAGKNSQFAKIPLSAKALEILRKVKALNVGQRGDAACIFPGKQNGHITGHTMLKLLQADHPGLTVHGFRTSFRSWGADLSSIDSDTLEYCLHHIEGSRTVQAYMRAECLEKRRRALEAWADYVAPTPARPHLHVVA